MLYHFFFNPRVFCHLRDNAKMQMEHCKKEILLPLFIWVAAHSTKTGKKKNQSLVLFISVFAWLFLSASFFESKVR